MTGANEAPIGNGYLGSKWFRKRYVTLKGQGRDPNMLRRSISKTAGDTYLNPMNHQQEMAY